MIKNLTKKLLPIAGSLDQAQYEAWLLLEKVTGRTRINFLVNEYRLSNEELETLAALVQERLAGKPLAYILGTIPFAGITLTIVPPILIPRPETEQMVSAVCESLSHYAQTPLVVLDMCTGSGCIALALAAHFPLWHIIGVDNNPAAIALAQQNKQALGLTNVHFEYGSLFEPASWSRPFDLIVSNPPYVSKSSYDLVGADVLAWEDSKALFADLDGYAFYDELIIQAKKLIRLTDEARPQLIFEFGVDQQNMTQYLLDRSCRSIKIHKDYAGLDRWSECQI